MKGQYRPFPALSGKCAERAEFSIFLADHACNCPFFPESGGSDGGVCGFPCRAAAADDCGDAWFCWFHHFGVADGKAKPVPRWRNSSVPAESIELFLPGMIFAPMTANLSGKFILIPMSRDYRPLPP